MNLYAVKLAFRTASDGMWIVEGSVEEHDIKTALARGDAIIVEVSMPSEVVTVHALPVTDLAGFGSLNAWCAFQCSGRDATVDSIFYRVDLEPVDTAREHRKPVNLQGTIWMSGPLKVCPEPNADTDHDEGNSGAAGGPDTGRKHGSEDDCGPTSVPVRRPRSPRGR